MRPTEYPYETFIPLDNEEHLLGRLTLNKMKDRFWVEIDLIFKESKKIYRPVDQLYDFHDFKEAVDQGVSRLAHYLQGKG